MNALILGAGSPAAIGVIKALKDSKFNGKIVSIDSNELSAGFFYLIHTMLYLIMMMNHMLKYF